MAKVKVIKSVVGSSCSNSGSCSVSSSLRNERRRTLYAEQYRLQKYLDIIGYNHPNSSDTLRRMSEITAQLYV